jgi:tetratricopeptide (TPR) repeat protein
MPSLIPGYVYDIFISYRQKDNKGDKWVSEFVEALKTELESTFKEEISVYFDINPHDGLLETHDVDASLKEKLKCLIFIPILSRTYCDPKSFAWEHEFKIFVDLASQDQYGLKVKLPNGNVGSRVLPVQIHELDADDKELLENELGGFIRGIEFIYKEPGVNKPLTPDDDENKNSNKTRYKIQVNKVAIAIKEIILGLKTKPVQVVKETTLFQKPIEEVKKVVRREGQEKTTKFSKRKLLSGGIVLAVLLTIAAILAYPKIFKRDSLEKLRYSGERISVVVMPFQNLVNDTTNRFWQIWIQDNLITSLAHSEELNIVPIQVIDEVLKNNGLKSYRAISSKLNVDVLLCGSIKQEGSAIFINAQLINSKTEEIYKTFEGGPIRKELINPLIDSLGRSIKNYLIISKLIKEIPLDFQSLVSTSFPDAYLNYLYGVKAWIKQDFPTEVNYLSKAVSIDSNFVWATLQLSYGYYSQGLYAKSKEVCLKLYNKKNQFPLQLQIWIDWLHADNFETPNESMKYLKQLPEIADWQPHIHYNFGRHNIALRQYDKAIPELEKALEFYKKWDWKPLWVQNYTLLGSAYHKTNQYRKEKRLYKKAETDFPNDPALLFRQAILALSEASEDEANRYIDKYISVRKENSASEAQIATNLAVIYSEAGILDKAEVNYREALSLEPEDPLRLNNLAYFLIDKDRNVSEGLELIDKAVISQPDNYSFLHCKGWGLYKQGKYQEALEILQKSWDLRREKAIYNHEAFLHLEAAKKAVANQKNN